MKKIIHTRTTPIFNAWRTLKLRGDLKTARDVHRALSGAGCFIDKWASNLLNQMAFTMSGKQTRLELLNVSVDDLGFKDGASLREIYRRAAELGLTLCPAEVGPQLRLRYKDQPKGQWLLIAMEPITDSKGHRHLFTVRREENGKRWLYANDGAPDNFWDPYYRWVFLRRGTLTVC